MLVRPIGTAVNQAVVQLSDHMIFFRAIELYSYCELYHLRDLYQIPRKHYYLHKHNALNLNFSSILLSILF